MEQLGHRARTTEGFRLSDYGVDEFKTGGEINIKKRKQR